MLQPEVSKPTDQSAAERGPIQPDGPVHKARLIHNYTEEELLDKVKTLTAEIDSLRGDLQEGARESYEKEQQLRRAKAELTLKQAALLDFKACFETARTFD